MPAYHHLGESESEFFLHKHFDSFPSGWLYLKCGYEEQLAVGSLGETAQCSSLKRKDPHRAAHQCLQTGQSVISVCMILT